MKVARFRHDRDTAWSVERFPELDSPRTLVLVFGTSDLDEVEGPIADLVRAFPQSMVVGCSSAGEIHGACVGDGGLVVAVAMFEKATLRTARVDAGSVDSGALLARELMDSDLKAMFVLSDGISVNGTALLDGIHSVVGQDVVVTGGLAGDGTRFERTWVLAGGKARSGQIVAVGLYGDAVGVSHGSRGGWDAFGPERVVTRSKGNILYELDGEPALALYKAYLGDRAADLPASALLFPLALRTSAERDRPVVRTILSIDEENQALRFAGDIPQESLVQLMRANFDRLIQGASEAGHAAAPAPGESLTIAISCVGRRIVLGERTEEEVEAALEAAPHDELVGFYSYGEISPFSVGQRAILHNQTMTLTRFWEG